MIGNNGERRDEIEGMRNKRRKQREATGRQGKDKRIGRKIRRGKSKGVREANMVKLKKATYTQKIILSINHIAQDTTPRNTRQQPQEAQFMNA